MQHHVISLRSNITNPCHVFSPGRSKAPRDWTEDMVFHVGLYIVANGEIRKAGCRGVLTRKLNPVGYREILNHSRGYSRRPCEPACEPSPRQPTC